MTTMLKRMTGMLAAAAALTALTLAPAAAQTAPPAEALGFMLGEWEGEGWSTPPGGGERGAFTVTESVQAGAGGHAVTLQGRGVGPDGAVLHDAAGLIWRERDGSLRIRSVTSHGQTVEAEIAVGESGFTWGFQAGPMGAFRYAAEFTDGTWRETGEFRAPDGEWAPFMEMTLTRMD